MSLKNTIWRYDMKIGKKAILLAVLLLTVVTVLPAETADWNAGYLQGYADAKAGKPNRLAQRPQLEAGDLGVWEVRNYVDSFGDPTDEQYLTQQSRSQGTFSNSATTGSRLVWYFLIDVDDVAIALREYGSYPVSYGDFRLNVKEADGTVSSFRMKASGDRLYITSDEENFREILESEIPVKLSIDETGSYSSSKYNLGEFNPAGFGNAWDAISD